MSEAPSAKRPRRAAAQRANEALASAHLTVAECADVHGTQSIALTSEDALERGDDICGHHSPNATTVVTCHTNLRPARLHRGLVLPCKQPHNHNATPHAPAYPAAIVHGGAV